MIGNPPLTHTLGTGINVTNLSSTLSRLRRAPSEPLSLFVGKVSVHQKQSVVGADLDEAIIVVTEISYGRD